jgi:hypothetical protein
LHSSASRSNPSRLILAAFVALLGVAAPARAQQQWTPPTPEELSMTSQPQVPGAAAVYLDYEETTDDDLHSQTYYVRLKVLTDAGKDFANVKLVSASDTSGDDSDGIVNFSSDFTDIQGRTIHSDGTIVPFTGKPYDRTVEKTKGVMETEKVFTLPDVEVGSILEYRFTYRIGDDWHELPTWFVQRDLFIRKAHFYWKAASFFTLTNYTTGNEEARNLHVSSVLPDGMTVKASIMPGTHPFNIFSLDVHDIAPLPKENYMPPVRSFAYRVNFYDTKDNSQDGFWKTAGGRWRDNAERFVGSASSMTAAVQTLVAAGDTDDVKLQKIYAAMMTMDNTNFSREHQAAEDRAHGLSKAKTAQDIWDRKRGSNNELAGLFVALVRAAGMNAYLMQVTNRDRSIFSPEWLSLGQLNDYVAIVSLNGKEQFFDPGERDCPFGQMAWKHSGTGGLRELAGNSTGIATTPEPPYSESQTKRFADLTLNADGTVTGTVQLIWSGAPALQRRQQALAKDEEELKHTLHKSLEDDIPSGLKVEEPTIDNLDAYDKPLIANFTVHGSLGTMTAKRIILPGQFFEANSKPLFPQPARQTPVYFNHSAQVIDAMRVKFPAELQVESAPKEDSFALLKLAAYHTTSLVQPGVVVMRRVYTLGTAFFSVGEYSDVKTFYDKMAVDDQQPILLSISAAAAPAAGSK